MADCIAVVSDMIFATRIRSTAEKAGAECRVVHSKDGLCQALEDCAPKAVLIDMDCDGVSAEESIRIVKAQRPHARVVAFFSHVQSEQRTQALAAGADDVWPRSMFVQRLPGVLSKLS